MSDVSARLSVTLAVQERTGGTFPALSTYPGSFERIVLPIAGAPAPKVFAASGAVPAASGQTPGAVVLNLGDKLQNIRHFYVENTSDPDDPGVANVTIAGGPVNATLSRGQILLVTNDRVGWPPASLTVTGTAGATFKLIALGE